MAIYSGYCNMTQTAITSVNRQEQPHLRLIHRLEIAETFMKKGRFWL